MFGDDDLTDVFYEADAGAIEFTLVGSAPVQTFLAHMGEEDEERFQGNAVGTVRLIQYPTAAIVLREGDELSDGTATWRVYSEPRLINDGAESRTYIVPASAD